MSCKRFSLPSYVLIPCNASSTARNSTSRHRFFSAFQSEAVSNIGSAFLALFLAVVAGCAKRLPVQPIPEQSIIAPVRGDMVHHRCRGVAARTKRMQGKEGSAGLSPLVVIATLRSRRAVGIMAGVAGAGAGDLTGATAASGNQTATGAGTGRLRHRGGPSGRANLRGQTRGQDRRQRSPACARSWQPCHPASPRPGAVRVQLAPLGR